MYRFKKWQEKTKVKLPRTGETELQNSKDFSGTKKFKHNQVKEADPNSQNSKKKAEKKGYEPKPKAERVVIKRGKKGKSVPARSDGRNAKNELRSSSQIVKDRGQKNKRQEKNGRHAKSGAKGGARNGSKRK